MSALPTPRITAQDVRRLIAERHGLGAAQQSTPNTSEWALFFELRNGTGYSGSAGLRSADAFAFNLYPSKKHWRVAYEIKVSRSDFLHELNSPQKRQWAFEISNEFWFACAPGVAKPEEIPEGCGLLAVSGSKLKRVVAAKQRAARALDMSEVAAIARKSMAGAEVQDAKWRYAGCELDEPALTELIATHWDQSREAHYLGQANTWYGDKIEQIAQALENAEAAMVEAGLEPLPWLSSIGRVTRDPRARLNQGAQYHVRDWVSTHVSPGPNGQDLAAAIAGHKRATTELERMQRAMQQSFEAMARQLAAAGGALAQATGKTPGGQPPARFK